MEKGILVEISFGEPRIGTMASIKQIPDTTNIFSLVLRIYIANQPTPVTLSVVTC